MRPAAEAHFVRQPERTRTVIQLDRNEVFGLALAFVAAAGAVVVALSRSQVPRAAVPVLAAAPDTFWRRVDYMLLIELPDSGGYIANDRSIDPDQLAPKLAEMARLRPGLPMGFYVRMGPHRPAADLQ